MARTRSEIKIFLLVILLISLLSSCSFANSQAIETWTPSPSATPTCPSGTVLSTPEGWSTSSKFVVILFDPHSIGGGSLEFRDGSNTPDALSFIETIIPYIISPGDLVSVFRLGPLYYEDARVTRLGSDISKPQLYDQPSDHATLTPIPPLSLTKTPGLAGIAAENKHRQAVTAQAETEQALIAFDNCARKNWDESAKLTATSWEFTEAVERDRIGEDAQATSETYRTQGELNSSGAYVNGVYMYDTAYFGLEHATLDFNHYCSSFGKCVLIIIDDLRNGWVGEYEDQSQFYLSGIQVLVSMPNCKDINQPSCIEKQTYWDGVFERAGVTMPVTYVNGERLEINLESFLGR